jgi:predicted metal-binding membrane protein
MNGMSMAHWSWFPGAAGYMGMWMAMMVPMMLPTLVPMLGRYRRTVRSADGVHLHGLTALVGAGYYSVWAGLGAAAFAVSAGLTAAEMHWPLGTRGLPVVAGAVLLAAGGLQLTHWKTRQLLRCREASGCGSTLTPTPLGAWQHGLRLGVRCALCCSGLMMALLAMGMMNLVAMAAVTLAITAERRAPAPRRIARVAGVAIVALGVVAIARI